MNKEELTQWALANGWKMIDGFPSLSKPPSFTMAIVRMVLKATMANIEIKKPSGKWDKVSGAAYAKILPDEDGFPHGLGLDTIYGITKLMEDNKYKGIFGKTGSGPKS